MQKFRELLKFKYTWRSYQQKFLDGFQSHIKDEHLHVVAPPGSGKTILGLEILIRIGKPTLVLAPTLTIRNQWRSRLLDFFAVHKDFNEYSLDLKKPSLITFSTYQSLFALTKSFDENEKQQLLDFITSHGIKTLVLDEAHHLKNEWWQCLYHL
ncbi:DEAD/DEAH box helicase family protein, partial [uncultured Maribacter sp.]